jgi:hypothetical protein
MEGDMNSYTAVIMIAVAGVIGISTFIILESLIY